MKRKIYLIIGTGRDLCGSEIKWNVKAFLNKSEAIQFVKDCEHELDIVKIKESLLLNRYEYIFTTEKSEFDGLYSLDVNLLSSVTDIEYEIENIELMEKK